MGKDLIIHIIAKTNSSKNEVVIESQKENEIRAKIYTTEIAENNKANKKIIEILSKKLKIPKSKLHLEKGMKSKIKQIIVYNYCNFI